MDAERKGSTSTREDREELLKLVWNSVNGNGLSKDVFERNRRSLLAPGHTTEEVVGLLVASGQVKWEDGNLVLNLSHMKLELDQGQEKALRKRARKNGVRPQIELARIVRAALSPEETE